MQTNTTHYVDKGTEVEAFILTMKEDGRRVMYLNVGRGGERATFIIEDTDFLDRLSNEAERLTREYVGDVPPLEPLPVELHGGPDVA